MKTVLILIFLSFISFPAFSLNSNFSNEMGISSEQKQLADKKLWQSRDKFKHRHRHKHVRKQEEKTPVDQTQLVRDQSPALFFQAAQNGDIEYLQSYLLKNGNINARSIDHLTALHLAILHHQEKTALFLLQNGADILLRDQWGNTPLILARSKNMTAVANDLEECYRANRQNFDREALSEYESNRHFAILIPSYNNAAWCQQCLASVFSQKYENYHLVFIDDCSNDSNSAIAEQFISEKKQAHRCQIVKNEKRCWKMANLYRAIHSSPDDQIIVVLDGDDWLANEEVLSYLNEQYATKNIWLTTGGYAEYPSGQFGFCRPIPKEVAKQNGFRDWQGSSTSQLRTFYSWLFKQLSLEDLFFEGRFFKSAGDVAKMLPMFELAGERMLCVMDRIVYIYNRTNPINDDKVDADLQKRSSQDVCHRKKRYTVLQAPLPGHEHSFSNARAALFLFIDSLQNIDLLMDRIFSIKDVEEIFILCDSDGECHACQKVLNWQVPTSIINTSKIISWQDLIEQAKSDHVLFLNGNSCSISNPIELNSKIRVLEKTQAYTWHGKSVSDLIKNLNNLEQIQDGFYAWQFHSPSSPWSKAHLIEMALYRKKDVLEKVKLLKDRCETIEKFRSLWQQNSIDDRTVGICSAVNSF